MLDKPAHTARGCTTNSNSPCWASANQSLRKSMRASSSVVQSLGWQGVLGHPVAVEGVLAQGGKAMATGLEPFDQRLQHGRRPRVLARPDAQVRHQNIARPDARQRLLQQARTGVALAGQLVTQKARLGPAHMAVATSLR